MAKPVILTVDDDPEVLQAVARDLRQQYGSGFRIVRADSGQSAIALHQIKPIIDRVFPLNEAPDAYRYLQSGSHFGKIVIQL
jgi:response regulator RpfG family c-di-GMP phosphodiesterase